MPGSETVEGSGEKTNMREEELEGDGGVFGSKRNEPKQPPKEILVVSTESINRPVEILGLVARKVRSDLGNPYDVIDPLKGDARKLGADAILCFRLAVMTSGGGLEWYIAYGTAVRYGAE